MSERACKTCGEFKPESDYSVKCKKTGRLFPACKTCRSRAAKKTAEPAGRDAKRHEAEPAERSADEAQLPADTARPADEARPADTQQRPAGVPTKRASTSALCQCGRFNVLPGHSRCLRCGRYA